MIDAEVLKVQHKLLMVSNLEQLSLSKESFGCYKMLISNTNPLGEKAVFKCRDESISEVFGYSLAQLLNVPVPDFLGVWFDKEIDISKRYHASKYQIAILIEYLTNPKSLTLEKIASQNKTLVARVLTLCLFDRHEWPEVFISNGIVTMLDLERIGPGMYIDEFISGSCRNIRGRLRYRQIEYVNASVSTLEKTISKARQIGVFREFQAEISRQGDISTERLRREITFTGHPYSHLLSAFFQSIISQRQAICAKRLGIKSWTPIDWEPSV